MDDQTKTDMPAYPPELTDPMREELTKAGVKDIRTADDVELLLGDRKGTALVIVNSVCGCAAGNARPGVTRALQNKTLPEKVFTVFAGVDKEAVTETRKYFAGYQPSSPQIALLKDGTVVKMLERRDIQGRTPEALADELMAAFNQYCA